MEASWKAKGQKADPWLVVLTLHNVEGREASTLSHRNPPDLTGETREAPTEAGHQVQG